VPRIRTIKPEFCTSEQVVECSTSARLLFVTMWCFCDDAGRHPASVRRLKMECFPGDPFTHEQMQDYVNELHASGLLVEYEHDGQRFWQVTGWKHQKIDRPNYKYPPFDSSGNPQPVEPISTSVRRAFDGGSTSDHPRKGSESKGSESKGRESSGIDDKSTTPTVRQSESKKTSVQRKPPTVEEVREYMAEKGYRDEAEGFVDFYSANGWVQGRGKPIKDWQAAVRNWQRNDFGKAKAGTANSLDDILKASDWDE
jgi:hypothetical protein